MILENSATIKLLKALVDVGPQGATREFILQKTGMANTTFYRVLKPLLRRGLVKERGNRFAMPLETPYNFLFKRLHDVEQLEELARTDHDRVLAVLAHAKTNLKNKLLALWLVGSAAHRQMTRDSDLDFLAVVKEETDYVPQRSYDVHFIQLSALEFEQRWTAKDDFVFTALRHGLLLEDRGFAQDYYSKPLPIRLKDEEFYKDEEDLALQKEAILRYIQLKAKSEAGRALANYANSIARRMLRVYSILPAGKPDLRKALHQLFGPDLAQVLGSPPQDTSEVSEEWSTEIVHHAHRLEEIYLAFSSHLSHLQTMASLLVEKAERFEQLVSSALKQLTPEDYHHQIEPPSGADLLVEGEGNPYLFELKSLIGPCTTAPLKQLKRYADEFPQQVTPVLIINPYRKIPVLERDQSLSREVRELAKKWNIRILTSSKLLELVNRSYLGDKLPPFDELIENSSV